jgi:hypothetical protein
MKARAPPAFMIRAAMLSGLMKSRELSTEGSFTAGFPGLHNNITSFM